METKTKKEATSKKEDAKSKAETSKKDVTASKADKKASADDQKGGTEFREFFIDELKDILWAEKALLKALPKMRKAATGKELAASFESHLSETENQISTLEQVFDMMGEKPKTKKCDAMEGLLSEAESIISDTEKGSAIRDAGLILPHRKWNIMRLPPMALSRLLPMLCRKPKWPSCCVPS